MLYFCLTHYYVSLLCLGVGMCWGEWVHYFNNAVYINFFFSGNLLFVNVCSNSWIESSNVNIGFNFILPYWLVPSYEKPQPVPPVLINSLSQLVYSWVQQMLPEGLILTANRCALNISALVHLYLAHLWTLVCDSWTYKCWDLHIPGIQTICQCRLHVFL